MSKRSRLILSDTDQNKRVAKKPRTDQTNFGEKPEAEPETVEYLDQPSPDIETDSVDNDMDDAATEKDTNVPDAYDTEDEDVVEIPKPTTESNSTTTLSTQVPESWTKRKKWTKTDLGRLNALLQNADCSLLDIIAAFPDFSKNQITNKISALAKKEEANAKKPGLACKFKERQSELKQTPSKSPIVDDKSGESGKSSLRVSDEKNGNPNTLVSPANTKNSVVKGMSTRKNLNVEHTEKPVAKQEASKANTPWPPEAQRINIAEMFGSMDEIQEQRMKCEKKIEKCTKKLKKWQRKKRLVDNVSKQLNEVRTKKQRSAAPEDG